MSAAFQRRDGGLAHRQNLTQLANLGGDAAHVCDHPRHRTALDVGIEDLGELALMAGEQVRQRSGERFLESGGDGRFRVGVEAAAEYLLGVGAPLAQLGRGLAAVRVEGPFGGGSELGDASLRAARDHPEALRRP